MKKHLAEETQNEVKGEVTEEPQGHFLGEYGAGKRGKPVEFTA